MTFSFQPWLALPELAGTRAARACALNPENDVAVQELLYCLRLASGCNLEFFRHYRRRPVFGFGPGLTWQACIGPASDEAISAFEYILIDAQCDAHGFRPAAT
jgi:hypothetical protein